MEADERFQDIKKLHETPKRSEAEAYLASGWRLLKVLTKRDEYEYASYVLGWPSDQPAIRPPSSLTGVFWGGSGPAPAPPNDAGPG